MSDLFDDGTPCDDEALKELIQATPGLSAITEDLDTRSTAKLWVNHAPEAMALADLDKSIKDMGLRVRVIRVKEGPDK